MEILLLLLGIPIGALLFLASRRSMNKKIAALYKEGHPKTSIRVFLTPTNFIVACILAFCLVFLLTG